MHLDYKLSCYWIISCAGIYYSHISTVFFAYQHDLVSPSDPAYWVVLTDASSVNSQAMLQALAQEPAEKVPLETSDPLRASNTESEHCQDPDVLTADATDFPAVDLRGKAMADDQTLRALANSTSWKTEELRATSGSAGSLQPDLPPSQRATGDRLANSSSNSDSFSDSGFAYVCIEDGLDAHACAHSKSASGSDDDSDILSSCSAAGAVATKQAVAVGAAGSTVTSEACLQLRLSREGESCRPRGCSSTSGLRRHRSGSV